MREIKFRVFSTICKTMAFQDKDSCWFAPNLDTTKHRNQSIGLNTALTDESLIPMQYTGLKDVNGIEIYEGDIVTSNLGKIDLFPAVIEFTNNAWELSTTSSSIDAWDLIVAGNIYENHELLES